jgi:hypothetical protein
MYTILVACNAVLPWVCSFSDEVVVIAFHLLALGMVPGVATILEYHTLMPDTLGQFIAAQGMVRGQASHRQVAVKAAKEELEQWRTNFVVSMQRACPVCMGPASHALWARSPSAGVADAMGLYRYGMGNATEAKLEGQPVRRVVVAWKAWKKRRSKVCTIEPHSFAAVY